MTTRDFNTKDITTPKTGLEVNARSYWLCEDGDPKKALFFGDAPQCNTNKRIVELLLSTLFYQAMNNLQIVYVEIAYVPMMD